MVVILLIQHPELSDVHAHESLLSINAYVKDLGYRTARKQHCHTKVIQQCWCWQGCRRQPKVDYDSSNYFTKLQLMTSNTSQIFISNAAIAFIHITGWIRTRTLTFTVLQVYCKRLLPYAYGLQDAFLKHIACFMYELLWIIKLYIPLIYDHII